jgi:hypothetical protein
MKNEKNSQYENRTWNSDSADAGPFRELGCGSGAAAIDPASAAVADTSAIVLPWIPVRCRPLATTSRDANPTADLPSGKSANLPESGLGGVGWLRNGTGRT